jgi:tetratricopeptide (TPR) repeat protein
MTPWPHRVTFLAPVLRLAPVDQPNASAIAHLLATILHEHLIRHPVLAMLDPSDQELTDDAGRLVNAQHPRFADAVSAQLVEERRDEVAWFELGLAPDLLQCRLVTRRGDGKGDQFAGTGSTPSDLVSSCLEQWFATRRLPASPRPLEPFTARDLLGAANQAQRIVAAAAQGAPGVASALLEYQRVLAVPLTRLVDQGTTELSLDDRILQIDPENPKSLFARARGSRPDLKRIVQMAPQWGKPYLQLGDGDIPADSQVTASSAAVLLMPKNVAALDRYASALSRAGRHEEGWRQAKRSSRIVPRFVQAHASALRALRECGRRGEAYLQAESRRRMIAEWAQPGRVPPGVDKQLREFLVSVAEACVSVGALEEGFQIAWEALSGARLDDHDAKVKRLEEWQTGAKALVLASARDAAWRNDPGRVVEGYHHGVEDSNDAAAELRAMTILGNEDLAATRFVALRAQRLASSPLARLAGARALILTEQLGEALAEIQAVQFGFPQCRREGEIDRLLRLAAVRPLAEWEQAITERAKAGATRLARSLARDAADYVPGADKSSIIKDALGERYPFYFENSWLDPLRTALGRSVMQEIDLFFAQTPQPTLEAADRLVARWTETLRGGRPGDPTNAAQSLFTTAQAFTRYLAATSQAASPIAGAYRQIATQALQGAARAGVDWLDESLMPFLGAIEKASGAEGVDGALLDTWLLRIERALELDAARGGHATQLVQGLKRVGSLLRGDERIAFEARLAQELRAIPDAASEAREMAERSVRALATPETALAYGELAEKLPPKEQLDARWTAAMASQNAHASWLLLGRTLLQQGKADDGVAAIARGLALVPREQRGRVLAVAELRGVWDRAKVDVPFDARDASEQGQNHLRTGKFEPAWRCLRWAGAVEPQPATLRALAVAASRTGRTTDCLVASVEADGEGGLARAGQALLDAKKHVEAARALRLAHLDTAEAHLLLGKAAHAAGDDESAALAYASAYQEADGRLEPADLAIYASVLYEVGAFELCEHVSEEILRNHGAGDANLEAAAEHALARSLLGRNRAAEAVRHAELAVREVIDADKKREYQETLTAAKAGRPLPPRSVKTSGPQVAARRAALDALEQGKWAVVQKAAGSPDAGWALRRAALEAAAFRGDGDSGIPVTSAARSMADSLLDATCGQMDPEASFARVRALAIREDASFSVDPPPPLRATLSRDELTKAAIERAKKKQQR